ncbi:MAG: toll/interleukin-1 receptor domain-containing protein [Spirochaetales bacterium]|nr:toll/interleukin-1 receptor domain-containing protein [Spirochaetales bacterium]
MEKESKFKYWAFISYSSKDNAMGKRLHKQLENYSIPKEFRGTEVFDGSTLEKRLRPVFRDRDELSSSAKLGDSISKALEESRFLIVLCSKNSAKSEWVNKEIETFKKMGRTDRILALILDGEPNATTNGNPDQECFPPALQYPEEPIAGDLRKTADGKERGFLKVLAGLTQIGFDDLYKRHKRAKRRSRRIAIALSVAAISLFSGMGFFAYNKYEESKEAKRLAMVQESNALTLEGEELFLQEEFHLAVAKALKAKKFCAELGIDSMNADILLRKALERNFLYKEISIGQEALDIKLNQNANILISYSKSSKIMQAFTFPELTKIWEKELPNLTAFSWVRDNNNLLLESSTTENGKQALLLELLDGSNNKITKTISIKNAVVAVEKIPLKETFTRYIGYPSITFSDDFTSMVQKYIVMDLLSDIKIEILQDSTTYISGANIEIIESENLLLIKRVNNEKDLAYSLATGEKVKEIDKSGYKTSINYHYGHSQETGLFCVYKLTTSFKTFVKIFKKENSLYEISGSEFIAGDNSKPLTEAENQALIKEIAPSKGESSILTYSLSKFFPKNNIQLSPDYSKTIKGNSYAVSYGKTNQVKFKIAACTSITYDEDGNFFVTSDENGKLRIYKNYNLDEKSSLDISQFIGERKIARADDFYGEDDTLFVFSDEKKEYTIIPISENLAAFTVTHDFDYQSSINLKKVINHGAGWNFIYPEAPYFSNEKKTREFKEYIMGKKIKIFSNYDGKLIDELPVEYFSEPVFHSQKAVIFLKKENSYYFYHWKENSPKYVEVAIDNEAQLDKDKCFFSTAGELFGVAGTNYIDLYNFETGKLVKKIKPFPEGSWQMIYNAKFSDDDKFICFVDSDGPKLYDIMEEKLLPAIKIGDQKASATAQILSLNGDDLWIFENLFLYKISLSDRSILNKIGVEAVNSFETNKESSQILFKPNGWGKEYTLINLDSPDEKYTFTSVAIDKELDFAVVGDQFKPGKLIKLTDKRVYLDLPYTRWAYIDAQNNYIYYESNLFVHKKKIRLSEDELQQLIKEKAPKE